MDFRKMDPSSGNCAASRATPTTVAPLDRVNMNHVGRKMGRAVFVRMDFVIKIGVGNGVGKIISDSFIFFCISVRKRGTLLSPRKERLELKFFS
jgi:hypothetical protein